MKIFVAGHEGMVGSAICHRLGKNTSVRLLTADRSEVDLTRQEELGRFIETHLPDQIYLAAAKVGGIYANSTYPYDFILKNLQIQSNVIEAARKSGQLRKFTYLPKEAEPGTSTQKTRLKEIKRKTQKTESDMIHQEFTERSQGEA